MVDVSGEIALLPTAAVSEDTSLAFRLAATAAELDQPIAKGSLHRLADRMPPPGDPWDPELLAALIRLLAAGHPAIDKIESLDQHGLVVRIIPEWAAVRNKPQRNAYHTYTVDRHLLEAAAVAVGAHRLGGATRSPADRRPAARHRQRLSWRSHGGRHEDRAPTWPPAWGSRSPTSRYWSTWSGYHLLLRTPRRAATWTTPTTWPMSPGPRGIG